MATITATLHNWLKHLRDPLPRLYLVGGAVRDHLLSRPAVDIDLMCDGPETVARDLAKARDAAMVPFLKKADAPCYRVVDRKGAGNHIDFVPVQGGSIDADLSRRDFTINAMAMRVHPSGELGDLIDPFGGRRDLENRTIRIAGPDTLPADPLRIFRAVRFAVQLRFAIHDRTLAAMASAAGGLKSIAGERIRDELAKTLACSGCGPYIRILDDQGILKAVFPEIGPMKGCTQNDHHHLDVWGHSLAVLENCDEILADLWGIFGEAAGEVDGYLNRNRRGSLLKLAALFHDCGKPDARQVDEGSGRITFHGHDQSGAERVEGICDRLKLSGRDRAFVRAMVSHHMHALFLSRPDVRQKTLLRWFRRLGEEMIPLIILSVADVRATLGRASRSSDRKRHETWAAANVGEYYSRIQPAFSRKPLIDGNDLIAMGISPGPEIGRILKTVRETQDTGQIRDRDQALAMAEKLTRPP